MDSCNQRTFLRTFVALSSIGCFVVASYFTSFHFSLRTDQHAEHVVEFRFGQHAAAAVSETQPPNEKMPVIAIGGGITSSGVGKVELSTLDFAAKFLFFSMLLPSFCSTASVNFTYRFYFAYDYVDPVFNHPKKVEVFQKTFASEAEKHCLDRRGIRTSLHLVKCFRIGRPANAQNDAMLEAYLDSADYFYRINDDTKFETADWANEFVRVLRAYDPPLVGVVGPNSKGYGLPILTYDFVHRTHIEIFGLYYPRVFTDWCGDDWITHVYQPRRSTKVFKVTLLHAMTLGRRYPTRKKSCKYLDEQVEIGRDTLKRYVGAVQARNVSGILSSDGRRVISMSLFGQDSRYAWGAIRNAQLISIHFPGWRLRVYVPAFSPSTPAQLLVPNKVLNKLHQLGADIAGVHYTEVNNKTQSSIPVLAPRDWRLLVADDLEVDFFIIRDADFRLDERDAFAVNEWIAEVTRRAANGSEDAFPVHSIRFNPKRFLIDGLWGGRPRALRDRLGTLLTAEYNRKSSAAYFNTIETGSKGTSSEDRPQSMLENVLRPIISAENSAAFVHVGVFSPCKSVHDESRLSLLVTRRHPLLLNQNYRGYMVGRKYDENEELLKTAGDYSMAQNVLCR